MDDGRAEADGLLTVELRCADLDAAAAFYSGELGFRLDTIYPADAPRLLELSGFGIRLRLLLDAPAGDTMASIEVPVPIVSAAQDGGFATGRAGMQYRDLIPGRFGGRVIASHIRIVAGGPVPDYVHHHDIRFQMIYCLDGWVDVAYEGQGEALRLHPGDCFLQPPHIRHRVLACAAGTEVLEIASPAEHETRVEHDLRLPTARYAPEHEFGGQRFVFHEARRTPWIACPEPGFDCRDTGIADATRGMATAVTLRRRGRQADLELTHEGEIRFLFVLAGRASLQAGSRRWPLARHSGCAIPAHVGCALREVSADFRMLDVSIPSRPAGPPGR